METVMKSSEVKPRIATLGSYVAKAKSLDPRKYPNDEFELFSVPSHAEGKPEVVVGKTVGASKQMVEDDTVLLCKINPRINRVWVVSSHTVHKKVASSEWMTFPPNPDFLPRYLGYYLQQDELRDHLALNASGVGGSLMRAKPGLVKDYPFPLFPLPEQRRIVAAIERHLGRLDAGVARLHAAKGKLGRYRQAVLKEAVEGRLLYPDLEDGELPKGWEIVHVEDVGQIVTGSTPSKRVSEYYGAGHPFYKPTDLEAGYHTAHSIDGLTDAGLDVSRRLPAKSTLITCIGATIGKTGFIRTEGACNQQINAIIPGDALIPEYAYFHSISPFFQQQIKDNASATTLPLLNKGRFKLLDFTLPTKSDQVRILEEIEKRLATADETESTLDAQLAQAERLRQSVLKRAFEGRLVGGVELGVP